MDCALDKSMDVHNSMDLQKCRVLCDMAIC